ncbi:MAG: nitroreductase/quinone reductase family protein [Acidimicrobiia bacterium]
MTDTTPSRPPRIDIREQNKGVIEQYRASAGKPADGAMPLVLLTTTGTRSGKEHTTPVCVREDGDTLVVAGTKGGMPRHPQWYVNLVANPALTVEYLGDTYRAHATTVENSPDRDRLFEMMSAVIPGIYGYQDRCRDTRQIPVVRLTRI